ncbi:hypothetical protein ACIQLK_01660 [Microbacterium sp. NPDC091382]|uniref:hypothetical protein n=1 Tax=Microbacterium sp. NPDC091382 TaxID=3364210 RepID=UPI0037FE4B0C
MTKQLVNLIGAVVSVGILLAGALLFALPQFTGAQRISADAASVEQSNATQQAVLDGLAAQAADMTALDAEVAKLRRVVPASVRADDIVQLAADAASTQGGKVVAVTVGETTPFAARTAEAAAGTADGAAATETTTETTEQTQESDAAPTDAPAAADGTAVPAGDGPQQVSITLSISAPDSTKATAVIDELRKGPRAVAITNAGITTDDDGTVTAEVTLLAFYVAG